MSQFDFCALTVYKNKNIKWDIKWHNFHFEVPNVKLKTLWDIK